MDFVLLMGLGVHEGRSQIKHSTMESKREIEGVRVEKTFQALVEANSSLTLMRVLQIRQEVPSQYTFCC